MDMRQLVMLTLQVSIIATVFAFGLRTSLDELLAVFRRPGLLIRALVAMLVVMPIVAVALVRTFDFVRAIEIALVALAISPVPPLLPKRQGKVSGEASYGIALMATIGALSIVAVPLEVGLLAQYFGLPLGMSSAPVAGIVVKMILGPLVIGMMLHAFAPELAGRLADPVLMVATVLLVLGALPVLVQVLPAAWRLVGDGTILAIALFVLIGLTVGHFLGGPDHASTLALATACRHPAIAFAVASANFPEERFGGAIVLYLLVSLVVSLPYLRWASRQADRAAATA